MEIEFERWQPGLDGRFVDRYGDPCSIADGHRDDGKTPLLCLGTEDDRMVLTQDMVRALLPHLTRFVETGRLEVVEKKSTIPGNYPCTCGTNSDNPTIHREDCPYYTPF